MLRFPSSLSKYFPFRSKSYWESRYRSGGTSGAGSYGRLAEYKATFINDFARKENIPNVVEFGSGDGNQCSLFEFREYAGVDVSREAVRKCRERFSGVEGWRFFHSSDPVVSTFRAPLVLSLDVIFHLVEDSVFDGYMRKLFRASEKFVLIYSSNYDSSPTARHVRHRKFTDWISHNSTAFKACGCWENPFPMNANSDPDQTSFAKFHLFRIREDDQC